MSSSQDQSPRPEADEYSAEFLTKRFRVFILGAGFSQPAGLPLAAELWKEVLRRAKTLTGRASFLQDDLREYIAFRRKCDGVAQRAEEIDFEDFMAFLDIEHYLGLRGKETWSDDGNEGQIVVKTLIGEILAERTPQKDNVPELYLQFARLLQPTDYILTFNYDLLLERALERVGVPYRLFPTRLEEVRSDEFATVDSSRNELVVIKLHGSVDWFDRRSHTQLEEQFRKQGSTHKPSHPVFNSSSPLTVTPLIDGPCFSSDPLRQVHRVLEIEKLYRRQIMFLATPLLLNPSSAKIVYSQTFRDFWWGLGDVGTLNFGMVIVGFSLPPQDNYARQVIYRLVTNYQRRYSKDGEFAHKKTPLLMIDHRASAAGRNDYFHGYRFVTRTRAKFHFAGFDQAALSLISQT